MSPNFIIVGTTKGGTTALGDYLSQHPDVFMADAEVHFFDKEENYREGLSWYGKHFEDVISEKAIGEKTPAYMHFRNVPEKIYKDMPEVKLIFMLRNPINRAYSNYRMNVLRRREKTSFEEAVNNREVYLKKGLYADQIKNYLKYFPKKQMVFIISEEFRANKAEVLKKVLRFLDVDENFVFPDLADKHVGMKSKSYFYSLMISIHSSVIRHTTNKIIKNISRKIKKSFLYIDRIKKHPPMNKETRKKLEKYFSKPNKELEGLISRDLSKWWQ